MYGCKYFRYASILGIGGGFASKQLHSYSNNCETSILGIGGREPQNTRLFCCWHGMGTCLIKDKFYVNVYLSDKKA